MTKPKWMSDEQYAHYILLGEDIGYWPIRNWHPVIVSVANLVQASKWVAAQGLRYVPPHWKEMDAETADWSYPAHCLYLFRDPELAVEMKLRWS